MQFVLQLFLSFFLIVSGCLHKQGTVPSNDAIIRITVTHDLGSDLKVKFITDANLSNVTYDLSYQNGDFEITHSSTTASSLDIVIRHFLTSDSNSQVNVSPVHKFSISVSLLCLLFSLGKGKKLPFLVVFLSLFISLHSQEICTSPILTVRVPDYIAEFRVNGVAITECNDGIDNDGDGLADYLGDPDCKSRGGDSELGNQYNRTQSWSYYESLGDPLQPSNYKTPNPVFNGNLIISLPLGRSRCFPGDLGLYEDNVTLAASRLALYPPGHRTIFSWNFHLTCPEIYSNDFPDTRDYYPSINKTSLFIENYFRDLKNRTLKWFGDLKNLGAELDYVLFDIEYGFSNWVICTFSLLNFL